LALLVLFLYTLLIDLANNQLAAKLLHRAAVSIVIEPP
jgi:hypothetical protein